MLISKTMTIVVAIDETSIQEKIKIGMQRQENLSSLFQLLILDNT